MAQSYHKNPLVSIIVPCFNYSATVGRAIKSVMVQTINNVEIIVVDDGSDNRQAVKDAVEQASLVEKNGRRYKDTRVSLYRISNSGVANARNYGIGKSSAPFICCLDADDQIEPKFLEACVTALQADRSLGIAYTGLTMLRADGARALSNWPTQPDYDKQLLARSPTDLKGANQIPTCNVFRREAWARTGGYKQRYAPLGAGAEDGEFWARIMSIGYGARKVADAGLFVYSMDGRVSTPFADGSIDKKLLEPDWLAMHPWAVDKQHPLASRATPEKQSHPVRQYDQPDVSVIIPVGPGHEKIVENALDSLEAQTFRRWEAIVVWDVPDNDSEFLKYLPIPQSLQDAYPYAKFIRVEQAVIDGNINIPMGAGAGRNVGAKYARAPFLVFLDADDSLAPTFLEECIENWRVNKTIGYTDYINKAIIPEESLADWKPEDILSYIPSTQEALIRGRSAEFDCERAQLQPSRKDFFHWCLVTAFIPKSWHNQIGGFDESMETFEDVLYHWSMARHGFCYSRIPELLVVYRMYTGNRREIASLYTDEGRQKARDMLEYSQEVLERIDTVACKKCPGGQPKAKINVYQEMDNYAQKEAAAMADKDMIMVEYTSANIGNHHVVGAATGTRYGYRGGGTEFLVHKLDIEAQPHLFRPMAQSVPAPVEPTPAVAPPTPIERPSPSAAGVAATNGDIPEYIAPVAPATENNETPTVVEPAKSVEPVLDGAFVSTVGEPRTLSPEAGQLAPEGSPNTYVPPTIANADEEVDLEAIPGITTSIAKELRVRGLTTKRAIATVGVDGLREIPGIGETRAEAIMTALALDSRMAT